MADVVQIGLTLCSRHYSKTAIYRDPVNQGTVNRGFTEVRFSVDTIAATMGIRLVAFIGNSKVDGTPEIIVQRLS